MFLQQSSELKTLTSYEFSFKLNLATISDTFEGKDDVVCCLFDDLNRLLIKIMDLHQEPHLLGDILEAILVTLEFLILYVNNVYYAAKQQLYDTIKDCLQAFSNLFRTYPIFLQRLTKLAEMSVPPSLLKKAGSIALSGVALPGYDLIDWNRVRRFKSEPPKEFQEKLSEIRQYIDSVLDVADEKIQYQKYLQELRTENLNKLNDSICRLSSEEVAAFNTSDITLLLSMQKAFKKQRDITQSYIAKDQFLSTIRDGQFISQTHEVGKNLTKIIQAVPPAHLSAARFLLETSNEGSSSSGISDYLALIGEDIAEGCSSSGTLSREETLAFPPVAKGFLEKPLKKRMPKTVKGKEESVEWGCSSSSELMQRSP